MAVEAVLLQSLTYKSLLAQGEVVVLLALQKHLFADEFLLVES